MFALLATLALFLAGSASAGDVSTARALLSGRRGSKKDRCYDYGYECHKDDDCCGCLECHYGYCGQPCVRKGGYCDYYSYCCEGYYCYGFECVERLPCYPVHYHCDRDSDCCDGLKCYEGFCYPPCQREGDYCDDYYYYCCEGYKCKDYCCEKERKGRKDDRRD